MNYWLYILYSDSLEKYYVGSTQNLNGRLRRHLTNHKGYTGIANDWHMVYVEKYPSKEEAMKRERQIKQWKSKILIRKLILKGTEHPDF